MEKASKYRAVGPASARGRTRLRLFDPRYCLELERLVPLHERRFPAHKSPMSVKVVNRAALTVLR